MLEVIQTIVYKFKEIQGVQHIMDDIPKEQRQRRNITVDLVLDAVPQRVRV